MHHTHHPWTGIAVAALLAGGAPFALAQTNPGESEHPQSGAVTHTPPFQTPPPENQNQNPTENPDQAMPPRTAQANREMGRHDMTGTVKSVSEDNIVEVRTDDGTLKVHFPEASQNLKKGDTITLHLAYTIDSSPSSSSSSM